MTDLRVFRVYEPWELGSDGYPLAWHGDRISSRLDEVAGVKNIVRAMAEHRCIRCGHPYTPGCGTWEQGEDPDLGEEQRLMALFPGELSDGYGEAILGRTLWSLCDSRCTHGGPVRLLSGDRWVVLGELSDGVTAGSLVQHGAQAAWRILTVHHLNERKFDLRWHNLVSLCQRCHLNVQRRVKMDRAYPWDHSAWFRPYVAAHYAAKFLGEELTREETETRLDELLALGKQEESVERMPL